ncbi:MAG: hypothetical protein ACI4B5_09115 [Bacteroidaceae bacterium]
MKKIYESPSTTCMHVEMEGRLCAGSVVKDDKSGVTVEATPQDYEEVDISADKDNFTWE